MAISYVGQNYLIKSDTTNGVDYQIMKPSGVVSGDFMVAVLAFEPSTSSERTVNPPTGWTLVRSVYSAHSTEPCQIAVMSRVAGSSEPGTWSGTASGNFSPLAASIVSAYRGVASFSVTGESVKGSGTSYSTALVNNAASNNWRIVGAAYLSGTRDWEIDTNEVSERRITGREYGGLGIEVGVWDSNGTISTGNTSRTVSRGAVWSCSASFIGILDATDTSIPGTMALSLPFPSMTTAASISYTGTMAASLPMPTMTASGLATPPEGPLDVIVPISMDFAGNTPNVGTFDVAILPIIDFVAETKPKGVRVVGVSAEVRRIVPTRGAS